MKTAYEAYKIIKSEAFQLIDENHELYGYLVDSFISLSTINKNHEIHEDLVTIFKLLPKNGSKAFVRNVKNKLIAIEKLSNDKKI